MPIALGKAFNSSTVHVIYPVAIFQLLAFSVCPLFNMSVPPCDFPLLHEVFKNWSLNIKVNATLKPLVNKHPWIKKTCLMWKEWGQWEYWQLMSNCPFCLQPIPRVVSWWACCCSFDRLISPISRTVDAGASPFSPIHKNKVYINYTRDYGGKREEYWIQVMQCLECGQGLCCPPHPCCRAEILSRFGVREVGS